MSKKCEINKQNSDLEFPRVKVLQYSYVEMRSSWDNPSRNAPFWRLYWNRTPGARIVFQDQSIELKQENVLLIPPHTNYASVSFGTFFQFYMHFEWESPLYASVPQVFSSAPVKKHLMEVVNWFGKQEELFEIRMYAILFYYLAELQSRLPAEQAGRSDARVERALEIINEDLTLSNGDVARKVKMSRDNFQRTFQRCIGMTPCRYRISRRMELAQELLQNSFLSMDEIAQQTGFADRYQFSKSFKQFFKVSPGSVRKKQQN